MPYLHEIMPDPPNPRIKMLSAFMKKKKLQLTASDILRLTSILMDIDEANARLYQFESDMVWRATNNGTKA